MLTLGYIILFLLLLSLWGFYSAIRPFKITSSITPKNLNIPFEEVTFSTKDNIELRGWFIPSDKPNAKTIILLHGYPADKGNILLSRIFLHKNYNLLFFDFRYFGESAGSYTTVGKNEILDLLAAIAYLQSRGIHEVGVWGFSLGGSVALMTAAQSPAIKAVIAESSFARLDWMSYEYYRIPLLRYPLGQLTRLWAWLFLRYDLSSVAPANIIQKLKIPILLIHSEQDDVISYRHALLLQKALKQDPYVETIFIKNNSHGMPFENYEKTIENFWNKNFS
jgi:dipeptidyl aminopeptidase/acylaminoacyl peptidase